MTSRNEQEPWHREWLFEKLIAPYRRALIARAHRLTRNQADAEDLVQETLLRAYTRLDQLTATDTIRGWLHTILIHLFLNHRRDQERLPYTLPFQEDWQEAAHGRTPEKLVQQKMASQAAWLAIQKLPTPFRQVVILADIDGLSYEEIAESLNIPIGTVRSRLSRSRRILQRSLIQWGPDTPTR